MMTAVAIVIGLPFIVIGGLMSYYYIDNVRTWNKGICKDCGKPWKFVGYEKNGSKVFVCEDNKHMCIIEFDSICK